MAKVKNPDGSHLTLFACDDHYRDITSEMRRVKTKYSLFPINGPHVVPPPNCCLPESGPPPDTQAEDEIEQKIASLPVPLRILFEGACFVVMLVVGPFMLLYYGGKWILGWRPGRK